MYVCGGQSNTAIAYLQDDDYDPSIEIDVYGGISCGEIEDYEPTQFIVSTSGGTKTSINPSASSGVSGFSYIMGGTGAFTKEVSSSVPSDDCNECAITITDPICSGESALTVLKKFTEQNDVPITSDEPVKIVGAAKMLTGCDTEECALQKIAQENPSARIIVAETIRDNFKADGPSDSTEWLNNNNIDAILAQLCKKYPTLVRLPFHMIDMIDPDSQYSAFGKLTLKNIDIEKNILDLGKNMLCVVINTDTTGRPGIHWFCLFCDFRRAGTRADPYTIEYFNSSGSRARSEVAEWMHRAEQMIEGMNPPRFAKRVTAATVQHQMDTDSECGVYSLYYIYRRVKGAPIEEFSIRVPDVQMIKFRKKLFKNRDAKPIV